MFPAVRTDGPDISRWDSVEHHEAHVLEIQTFRKNWFRLVTVNQMVFIASASFATGERQAPCPFSTSVIQAWSLSFINLPSLSF